MASKLDQILSAMAAQNARIDAIAALVQTPAQTVQTTALAAPATTTRTGTKAARKSTSKAATEHATITADVSGTIEKIAAHGRGLVLVGHKTAEGTELWWNAAPALDFSSFSAGDRVTLTMGNVMLTTKKDPTPRAKNRVVEIALAASESAVGQRTRRSTQATITAPVSPPATTTAPTRKATATAVTAVAGQGAASESRCPFCNASRHNKYSTNQVTMECSERQYIALGNTLDMSDDYSVMNYAEWRMSTVHHVFAFNAQGYRVIGGSSAPSDPTPTPDETGKAPRKRGSKAGKAAAGASKGTASAVSTPAPSVALLDAAAELDDTADEPEVIAQETAPAAPVATFKAPTEGEHVGYVVKLGESKAHMVKLVNPDTLSGRDGSGCWVGCRPTSEKLLPKFAKLAVGDRVRVRIEKNIVRSCKVLDTAASVTGTVPGVKNGSAGKVEPRKQPVDRVVKAARGKAGNVTSIDIGSMSPIEQKLFAAGLRPTTKAEGCAFQHSAGFNVETAITVAQRRLGKAPRRFNVGKAAIYLS